MNIAYFGDSYSSPQSKWIYHVERHFPGSKPRIFGKGGTNLFYSIDQWLYQTNTGEVDSFDVVIWTLTWHHRLFHHHHYRNDQFCSISELRDFSNDYQPDPDIKTAQDNQEFLTTLKNYQKFIYSDIWARFDHELEIRWIMEQASIHNDKKFIFIPNTAFSLECSKKYFQKGILLDFAFEELSNREPGSPGPMPVNCGRFGHLNDKNHELFGEYISSIIKEYHQHENKILPVDLDQFDVGR